MEKEGKLNLLSILTLSIFIFLVYSIFVFGAGSVGVKQEFPVNFTNASLSFGVGSGSLPSMRAFNGTNPLFRCNISINSTSNNATNVSLFVDTSPLTNVEGVANQTFKINDTTSNQVINFTFPVTLGEGTYYWACRVEDNTSPVLYNMTENRTFIIDRTPPGFDTTAGGDFSSTTGIANTSSSTISTGNKVSVAVNVSDQLTSIVGARLFVNISGAATNEVNSTGVGAANGVAFGNKTVINLSFRIPGSALGAVLNFTLQVNDSVGNFNITSAIFSIADSDATPPGIVLNAPIDLFNQTSASSPTFNFTASDNNQTSPLRCGINVSLSATVPTNFTELNSIFATNNSPYLNTTPAAVSYSNGTYKWNVSCTDTTGNLNTSLTRTFTVDQIPPRFLYYNFTNASKFNTSGDLAAAELGQGNFSLVQGVPGTYRATLYVIANWTDNLTSPFQAVLQFYNVSAGPAWQTINTTTINMSVGPWSNMSFTIPTGHNNFEGANISFRVIANDTLGNVNNSASVKNFTIQINDTTKPTLTVTLDLGSNQSGNRAVNGTNTSDTTPKVVWNVTEGRSLKYVAVQIDALTDVDCGQKLNKTTTVNANRNGSMTLLDSGGCSALSDGAHTVRLTAEDEWGNSELYIHSFTVGTGTPTISLSTIQNHTNGEFPDGLSAVNKSNVTVYTGINFTAVDGTAGVMKDFSWTSSCNAAGETLSSSTTDFPAANLSFIWPFNFSGCKGAEANGTVSVTVTDSVGNSVTNLFQFAVDDLAPSLAVHSPTEGQRFTGSIDINVSAFDSMNRVDTFGYYLDNNPTLFNHTINGSAITPAQGRNTSILNLTVNLTAGTHTIKIRVNDTLGNARNSSVITFTQTGPIKSDQLNNSINAYLSISTGMAFNTTVRLKGADGSYNDLGSNETESDQTYEILLMANSSSANAQLNVTLTEINGSGANWAKLNFSMFINASTVQSHVQNNWTSTVLHMVYFNSSIDEFLPNANDYYGTVLLPGNISRNGTGGLFQEIWWISNESKLLERTNVSQCTAAFTRTTSVPCWNYTTSGRTLIQVPHFSIVVAVNDSGAPVITVNTPAPNQTESMFLPNITVTSDTVSCKYQVNKSAPSLSDNVSMSIVTTATDKYCIGQTERFKNLNTAIGYNITFFATDANGNERTGNFSFNVSDTTPSDGPNSSRVSTSVSSTSATVTIGTMNETVNVNLSYGTAIGTLSSTALETDFNKSQTVTLSSLTASTLYHFNVTVCDYNNNCVKNGTFNFTTSAAASSSSAAASSAGTGTGGGGGAAAASTVQAEKSQVWSSVPAGASVSMEVDKTDIAVTTVSVSVNTDVSNVEIKVSSLKDKPVAKEAAAKVYQYLQLTKKNVQDTQADKITIAFKVAKTWLDSNNLKSADVSLYRYKDDQWGELTTRVVSSDSTNVNYEADTPGFSYFAIGTKAALAEAAPVAPEEVAPPEAAPTPGEKPKPIEAPKKAPVGWIILAAVLVIGVIGYFVYQKKKGN